MPNDTTLDTAWIDPRIRSDGRRHRRVLGTASPWPGLEEAFGEVTQIGIGSDHRLPDPEPLRAMPEGCERAKDWLVDR